MENETEQRETERVAQVQVCRVSKMPDDVQVTGETNGALAASTYLAQVVAMSASFESAETALGKGAVLVDSGANEVVRPYQQGWYEEIMRGEKGQKVICNMAGGKTSAAAMTQHGEVMIPVTERTAESAHWIVPTCRLINELGCSLHQNFKGLEIHCPN